MTYKCCFYNLSTCVKNCNNIISYLTKNGIIEKKMLFEPPFTDIHDQGLFDVFDDDAQAKNVIKLIDSVNNNAVVSGF